MTLIEAIQSGKSFRRPHQFQEDESQWFEAGTGPYKDLVACDYFTHGGEFSTSIDLYYDDIIADDYIVRRD